MRRQIVVLTNSSSISDILKTIKQNSLLFLMDIHLEMVGIIVCTLFIIIGAGLYMFYKIKDNTDNNITYNKKIIKKNNIQKYIETSKSESFNYNKILNELHTLCNNCTNIFISLKCIEFISNYPELINVKLSDGLTPFHRVCFHGNNILIEYMLHKGADPELRTIAGENALCMVLYYYVYTEDRNFSSLETLYTKGCHFTFDDEWYKIFLKLSIKTNNSNLTKWLITHLKSPAKRINNRASSVPL